MLGSPGMFLKSASTLFKFCSSQRRKTSWTAEIIISSEKGSLNSTNK